MQRVEFDTDIPYAEYPPTFEDLTARVNAAFQSLAEVHTEGVEVTDDDIGEARSVFLGEKVANDHTLASPGMVVHLKALLDEYDHAVVQSAAQIRRYVTNKLLEESANPDARIRMRSLELLGKISDVGLFTDKTEVTLKHRPTEELEQLLRERLMKTIEAEPVPVPQAPNIPPSFDLSVFDDKPDAV